MERAWTTLSRVTKKKKTLTESTNTKVKEGSDETKSVVGFKNKKRDDRTNRRIISEINDNRSSDNSTSPVKRNELKPLRNCSLEFTLEKKERDPGNPLQREKDLLFVVIYAVAI